ncbi:MAG: NAD-dependent epimerase/dehydratase family protein [Solirubrobacterales bacterium]
MTKRTGMGEEAGPTLGRILITGGAGFIGSHLAELLIGKGGEVVVLDDLSTGREENLSAALETGRLELVIGSTDDLGLVDRCMAGADLCVHLGSAVGVKLVMEQPLKTLLSNVRGADAVLASAARHRRRVMIASSSEVYGKDSRGPLREDSDRNLGPISVTRWGYANAKAFAEFAANAYAAEGAADTVVFRLFNTTGPRQLGAYGMVLPRFVEQALNSRPLTVYGDGGQRRCFLHVADAVDAIAALAGEPAARGNTFNIGSSQEISIRELAALVIERSGSSSRIEYQPFEEAYGEGFEELGRRIPNTAALQSLTSWKPQRSLEDIVDDAIVYERSRTAGVAV